MSANPVVGILYGSPNDLEVMRDASAVLEHFGVQHEMIESSAHRNPERTRDYARTARERGLRVLICGAGMAAHLAGAVASETTLPVIGVPLAGGSLGGLDALLSTAQMPSGVPVAAVAIGAAGAKNAAVLAVQILALGDARLELAIEAFKEELAEGKKP
jgi:phosphoribosylaminoimidazole carboxylase PurE protein